MLEIDDGMYTRYLKSCGASEYTEYPGGHAEARWLPEGPFFARKVLSMRH
jgi:hypothetical protein